MECTLCQNTTSHYKTINDREFLVCSTCNGIQVHPKNHINTQAEKQRYLVHKNDINDEGYQEFVNPIVTSVKEDFSSEHLGLDFGCGTGPVITKLLSAEDYKLNLYDPYFKNDCSVLEEKYDYVVCCEVIEHFNNPKKEFELLASLLKPKGRLYIKTGLVTVTTNFENWWYKNDVTHVFFYSEKTFDMIGKLFNFEVIQVNSEVIILEKKLNFII